MTKTREVLLALAANVLMALGPCGLAAAVFAPHSAFSASDPGIGADTRWGDVTPTNTIGEVAEAAGLATKYDVARATNDVEQLQSDVAGKAAAADTLYKMQTATVSEAGGVYTYAAASNSVAYLALGAGTNCIAIVVPPAVSGRARDFGLTVATPYTNATIRLDTSVEWHFDEASTNIEAGAWTRLYCTECPAGVFTLQAWTPEASQAAE